tara:strand:- start:1742 stop:1981 length:240 start_codon:yes stop_codon:yes gene_type:complete
LTPEDEQRRAELARSVLENPVFDEAVNKIKNDLYAEFQNSPARDSEGREKIYLMGKMFDLLLVHLRSVMETGKLNKLKK